jgi:hypothetical protein
VGLFTRVITSCTRKPFKTFLLLGIIFILGTVIAAAISTQ